MASADYRWGVVKYSPGFSCLHVERVKAVAQNWARYQNSRHLRVIRVIIRPAKTKTL
jgi:hypothetical protein